jgi:hypothetical protein
MAGSNALSFPTRATVAEHGGMLADAHIDSRKQVRRSMVSTDFWHGRR